MAITRSDPAPSADPETRPLDLCSALKSSRAPSPGLFTVEQVRADGTICASADGARVDLVASDYTAAEASEDAGPYLRQGTFESGEPARIAVVSRGDGSAMIIARDTSSIVSVLSILKATLIGVVLLGGTIALLLSRWSSRAAMRPITRFTRVAEYIADTGDLERHAAPQVGSRPLDEVDRLAHAFNTMTSVLADAKMRQQRLVADAGHELRTPLSSLQANIQLLRRSRRLNRPLRHGEEERLLADLSEQVAELSRLVDDVAQLAMSPGGGTPMASIRLDDLVETAVGRVRRRSSMHVFDVELEPWIVQGDETSLERAVVNLLDNSVKFSPRARVIEVRLRNGVLTVSDRGLGILDADGSLAFERFWRSPAARSLPGSGLGLSIVADVVERHAGWVTLTPRPGGGAVATLYIPGEAGGPAQKRLSHSAKPAPR